jgi:hypothetical protein
VITFARRLWAKMCDPADEVPLEHDAYLPHDGANERQLMTGGTDGDRHGEVVQRHQGLHHRVILPMSGRRSWFTTSGDNARLYLRTVGSP